MLSPNLKFETLQLHAGQEVNLCMGQEHMEDIKADFEQAFQKVSLLQKEYVFGEELK
jgi:hypothetical protein